MPIRYINTGSGANSGDGDSLRSAFIKVNNNFAFIESIAAIGYTGSAGPSFVNIYTSGSLYIFDGSRRWYAPYNLSVNSVVANIVTSADANVIFAIKKNGIIAATITIATGQLTTTYTTPFTMSSGDYLTISITQAGSSNNPGSELYVQLKYTQTS